MTTDIRSHGANPPPADAPGDRADPGHHGKRPYHTPRLQDLGDLRGVTLGGSNEQGDSATSLRRSA